MKARMERTENLRSAERKAMFALMESHFEGVTPRGFEEDLGEKQWTILMESPDGRIVGFSTLMVYRSSVAGGRVKVLCSGDTIVEPSFWGSRSLPRLWLQSVLTFPGGSSSEKLYWLYICSGFRTYRFLPVFLRTFFPTFRYPTPPRVRALMNSLAGERWGSWYDPSSGVMRFPVPQVLKSGISPVTEGRLRDPHVAFFAQANPGADRGDELVCLAEISEDNLTKAGRRLLRREGKARPGRGELLEAAG